jgi:protoporphyrinogen oxidase
MPSYTIDSLLTERAEFPAMMTSAQAGLDNEKVLIVGAGPTGLGAAHRLLECGYGNFLVVEKERHAGGLASSFTDSRGFTWDIGGHVQFSHYEYFDKLMDSLLPSEWLHHERESWVWILNRFVPYPFQNNIRHLPREQMFDCLSGLIDVQVNSNGNPPLDFEQWILRSFGEGVARLFMFPYNFKVWAYPAADLNCDWIGERVATIDLKRIVFNILNERDDVAWGPNNTFRFPARGGTGEVWRRLAARLPQDKLQFGKALRFVDTKSKTAYFEDGSQEEYGFLISTIPLNVLVANSDLDDDIQAAVQPLRHSATNIVGIGLKGSPPPHLQKKCWMYFPEPDTPFYRATVYSNYSPHNVPDISRYWSLMFEVSESAMKPVDPDQLLDSVIAGARAAVLIEDPSQIVDTWIYRTAHGYPTPTLGRNSALDAVLPALDKLGILSRGRFGGWKYEVSNQDHCLMQGVEAADRLLAGSEEQTLFNPGLVNRTNPNAPKRKAS